MPKDILGETELSKLKNWLEEWDFEFARLNRNCADAVRVAYLIKNLWPELIDLHNYVPQSNAALKLANWEVLNRKALGKLGLYQKSATLEQLAKGLSGVIETLLYGIMQVKRNQERVDEIWFKKEQENEWMENGKLLVVTIKRRISDGGDIIHVPGKMILYSMYEEMLREIKKKEYKIDFIQQKFDRLKDMLVLKEERIEKLSSQISKLLIKVEAQIEYSSLSEKWSSVREKTASEVNTADVAAASAKAKIIKKSSALLQKPMNKTDNLKQSTDMQN